MQSCTKERVAEKMEGRQACRKEDRKKGRKERLYKVGSKKSHLIV